MPKPVKLNEAHIAELREIIALVTEAWERYRDHFSNRGLGGAVGRDPHVALHRAVRLCQDRLEDATGERQASAPLKGIGFSEPVSR